MVTICYYCTWPTGPRISHDSLLIKVTIILPYSLRIPSDLFSSGFLTKILCAFPFSPMHVECPTHFIILDLITVIFGNKYKLRIIPNYVRHCPFSEVLYIYYTQYLKCWLYSCLLVIGWHHTKTDSNLVDSQGSPTWSLSLWYFLCPFLS